MLMQLGLGLNRIARFVKNLIERWILADTVANEDVVYVWQDSATWDDTKNWSD